LGCDLWPSKSVSMNWGQTLKMLSPRATSSKDTDVSRELAVHLDIGIRVRTLKRRLVFDCGRSLTLAVNDPGKAGSLNASPPRLLSSGEGREEEDGCLDFDPGPGHINSCPLVHPAPFLAFYNSSVWTRPVTNNLAEPMGVWSNGMTNPPLLIA